MTHLRADSILRQPRSVCEKRERFWISFRPAMKCCCSALHAEPWTISRDRLRWKRARPLASIVCRSLNLRLVSPPRSLRARGDAPASGLGHEAVAARAAFEAAHDEALEYFAPVSNTPDFPRRWRERCSSCDWPASRQRHSAAATQRPRSRRTARSRRHIDGRGRHSDRASLFATATQALSPTLTPYPSLTLGACSPPRCSVRLRSGSAIPLGAHREGGRCVHHIPAGDARAVAQLQKRGVSRCDLPGDGRRERSHAPLTLPVFQRVAVGT